MEIMTESRMAGVMFTRERGLAFSAFSAFRSAHIGQSSLYLRGAGVIEVFSRSIGNRKRLSIRESCPNSWFLTFLWDDSLRILLGGTQHML